MGIQLQDLLLEGFPAKPPLSQLPDIRRLGAALVSYIRKNVGKDVIKRWDMENRDGKAIVRIYLPVTHHDPSMNFWNQPLPRIMKASTTFNAPFRMFSDGNLICIEWEMRPTKGI